MSAARYPIIPLTRAINTENPSEALSDHNMVVAGVLASFNILATGALHGYGSEPGSVAFRSDRISRIADGLLFEIGLIDECGRLLPSPSHRCVIIGLQEFTKADDMRSFCEALNKVVPGFYTHQFFQLLGKNGTAMLISKQTFKSATPIDDHPRLTGLLPAAVKDYVQFVRVVTWDDEEAIIANVHLPYKHDKRSSAEQELSISAEKILIINALKELIGLGIVLMGDTNFENNDANTKPTGCETLLLHLKSNLLINNDFARSISWLRSESRINIQAIDIVFVPKVELALHLRLGSKAVSPPFWGAPSRRLTQVPLTTYDEYKRITSGGHPPASVSTASLAMAYTPHAVTAQGPTSMYYDAPPSAVLSYVPHVSSMASSAIPSGPHGIPFALPLSSAAAATYYGNPMMTPAYASPRDAVVFPHPHVPSTSPVPSAAAHSPWAPIVTPTGFVSYAWLDGAPDYRPHAHATIGATIHPAGAAIPSGAAATTMPAIATTSTAVAATATIPPTVAAITTAVTSATTPMHGVAVAMTPVMPTMPSMGTTGMTPTSAAATVPTVGASAGAAIVRLDLKDAKLGNFSKSRVLDRDVNTKFDNLLLEFQQLGGEVKPGITLNWNTETKKWAVTGGEENKGKVNLPFGARAFPVCQAGENRSQVSYVILGQMAGGMIQVMAPHGAEGSTDPFIMPTMTPEELNHADNPDWDLQTAFQYHAVSAEPSFRAELKVDRITRHSETECLRELQSAYGGRGVDILQKRNPETLARARLFMSTNYFQDIITGGGHVIAFNRSVHIMMMRLVEVAKEDRGKTLPLRGVVLHPIDSQDPVVVRGLPEFAATLRAVFHIFNPQPALAKAAAATATAPIPAMVVPTAVAATPVVVTATLTAMPTMPAIITTSAVEAATASISPTVTIPTAETATAISTLVMASETPAPEMTWEEQTKLDELYGVVATTVTATAPEKVLPDIAALLAIRDKLQEENDALRARMLPALTTVTATSAAVPSEPSEPIPGMTPAYPQFYGAPAMLHVMPPMPSMTAIAMTPTAEACKAQNAQRGAAAEAVVTAQDTDEKAILHTKAKLREIANAIIIPKDTAMRRKVVVAQGAEKAAAELNDKIKAKQEELKTAEEALAAATPAVLPIAITPRTAISTATPAAVAATPTAAATPPAIAATPAAVAATPTAAAATPTAAAATPTAAATQPAIAATPAAIAATPTAAVAVLPTAATPAAVTPDIATDPYGQLNKALQAEAKKLESHEFLFQAAEIKKFCEKMDRLVLEGRQDRNTAYNTLKESIERGKLAIFLNVDIRDALRKRLVLRKPKFGLSFFSAADVRLPPDIATYRNPLNVIKELITNITQGVAPRR